MSPVRLVGLAVVALCVSFFVRVALGHAGPDPAKWLLHEAGFFALWLLVLTLAVSPLRRLAGRPALTTWRRPLGLAAFSLASLHVLVYTTVYQGFAWRPIVDDVVRHPYILLGLAAFLLLLPMALTSGRTMQKRLGRHWKRIHRAIYVLVPLGIVHQGLAQKADLGETLVFSAFCGCFLLERAVVALRSRVKSKKSENAC